MPQVSILIPVYNTAALLPRCLKSVVEQTLRDIEIICVDDGSTDTSLVVLNEWAATDARIKVITQANGRQGKARNEAMKIAQGEYIGMVDSDDYIPTDYFERLYRAAQDASADIAMCGIYKEKPVGGRMVISYNDTIIAEQADEKLRLCNCPPDFHPVNKLYRREFLDKIGLCFAEGVQYEDVMFVLRALCESGRLVTVPGLHYRYVLNNASTVKACQTDEKQRQKYQAHRAMVEYATQHNIAIPNKYRNITVYHYSIMGICLYKIKECGNKRILRLFDLLPVWRWRNDE